MPDTLSSLLIGSPVDYSVSVAPPYFSSGAHIGPAAINRDNVNAYFEDSWRVNSRFTVDYGVRWELYLPISERARRTAGFLNVNGTQEYVVNPQPAYRTNWKGWGPRIQAAWQVTDKLQVHAGGAITVIPRISGKIIFSRDLRRLPLCRGCFLRLTRLSAMGFRSHQHNCRAPIHQRV